MGLWIAVAAVNGFLAVAMGAFAAHALQARLEPKALGWIETASRYEAIHALALFGVAILIGRAETTPLSLSVSAWAFTLGMLLFCGALYLMGLFGWRGLGAVAPFGGLALMTGWALLAFYGVREFLKA